MKRSSTLMVICFAISGCQTYNKLAQKDSNPANASVDKSVIAIFPGPVQMGTQLIQKGPDNKRIEIQMVVPGSPAEKSGLKAGDIIVALDGDPVSSPGEVIQIIQKHQAGDSVKVTIERDGKMLEPVIQLIPRRNTGIFDPRIPQVINPGRGSGFTAVMGGNITDIRQMNDGRSFIQAQPGDHFQIIGGSGSVTPNRFVNEGKILIVNDPAKKNKELHDKEPNHRDVPSVMISFWAQNQSADVKIGKNPIWFDLGSYSIRVGDAPIPTIDNVKADIKMSSNPTIGVAVYVKWESVQADCLMHKIEKNGQIYVDSQMGNEFIDGNVIAHQTYTYRITPIAFNKSGPSTTISVTIGSLNDSVPPKTSLNIGWPFIKESGKFRIGPNTPILLSLYDDKSGVLSTEVSIDGKKYGPALNPMFMSGFTEGPHVLRVKSRDKSGNWEHPISLSIELRDTFFSTTWKIDGFYDLQNEVHIFDRSSLLWFELDYNGSASAETVYGIDGINPDRIFNNKPIPLIEKNGFKEGPHTLVFGSRDSMGNSEPTQRCTLVIDQYTPYLREVIIGDFYHAKWNDSIHGKELQFIRNEPLTNKGLHSITLIFSEPVQGDLSLMIPNDLVEWISFSAPTYYEKGMIWRSVLYIDNDMKKNEGEIKLKVSARDFANNELKALNVSQKTFVQPERNEEGMFSPNPMNGPDSAHIVRVKIRNN